MTDRVKTGVAGLDEMLSGGLIRGSVALVRGAPGTGKTTLGMQFLYNGITQHEEPGILITFEEFPFSLHRDAEALGWDLRQLEKADKLRVIFTSPRIFLASLQSPDSPLNQTIREWGVERIVLDSVTHFERIARHPQELRETYNMVINGLKREGITTILTSEDSSARLGQREKGNLSFVVDTILMLRYVEIESAMQRAMVVLKMRGSSHAKEIRRFEITPGGIVVGEPFEGREGILTGSPTRVR